MSKTRGRARIRETGKGKAMEAMAIAEGVPRAMAVVEKEIVRTWPSATALVGQAPTAVGTP